MSKKKQSKKKQEALAQLHRQFEAVLHRITRHARVVFRYVKCWHTREDKIAEAVGHAWKWIQQLHDLNREWWRFVTRLADYACKAVKSGRKVAGCITLRDVMNEINQARKGYVICKLPDISTESSNPLSDALADNTVSEVPDQAAFRIDYPAWRRRFGRRDRRMIDTMTLGHRTKDLAQKFKISEGRISQKRREYQDDWHQFHGDDVMEA